MQIGGGIRSITAGSSCLYSICKSPVSLPLVGQGSPTQAIKSLPLIAPTRRHVTAAQRTAQPSGHSAHSAPYKLRILGAPAHQPLLRRNLAGALIGPLPRAGAAPSTAAVGTSVMSQQGPSQRGPAEQAAAAPSSPSSHRPSSPPMQAPPHVLKSKEDMYGGVIIDPAQLTAATAPEAFATQLRESLDFWRSAGKRGVWLRVPLAAAALVPVAASQGFMFHHAEPDYVMMTEWLGTGASTLPANASHQVGVGAFVVNEHGQVLVVQEASGPLKGKGVWKMPTGLVASGEDITLAAEREVLEETGVVAHVESVLALRQAHGFAFGKSDMFVVLGMRAAPGQDASSLVHQESELVGCKWASLEEYAGQEFFKGMQLYSHMLERCVAWAQGRYRGMRIDKMESSVVSRRLDLLVWGEDEAQQPLLDAKLDVQSIGGDCGDGPVAAAAAAAAAAEAAKTAAGGPASNL